jgi:hypothetical protein
VEEHTAKWWSTQPCGGAHSPVEEHTAQWKSTQLCGGARTKEGEKPTEREPRKTVIHDMGLSMGSVMRKTDREWKWMYSVYYALIHY